MKGIDCKIGIALSLNSVTLATDRLTVDAYISR